MTVAKPPSPEALHRAEFVLTWCAPTVVMPVSALIQSSPEHKRNNALREGLRYSLGPLAMFTGLALGELAFRRLQPRYVAHFASFLVGEATYLTYIGLLNAPVSRWLSKHLSHVMQNDATNPNAATAFSPLATATPGRPKAPWQA
jgi:hypothetical protein